MSDDSDFEIDGRRRRSVESRSRIIDAMLELVRSGDLSPTAETIAAHAGVGRRTVFRLFSDMDSVYSEIYSIMRDRAAHIESAASHGPATAGRMHALVDMRARYFEDALPIVEALSLHRRQSAGLQQDHSAVQGILRAAMIELLAEKERSDRELVESLDMLLSIDCWRRLRLEQRLDFGQSAAIIHKIVAKLLPDPQADMAYG